MLRSLMVMVAVVGVAAVGLMTPGVAAANGGASSATGAGAKIPKACFKYLKSVSEASSAVADGLVNLNDAVTQAENAASAAIAGDRATAQAALDATDAVNKTNTQMVKDAEPLMAKVNSNIPPCKKAIKKTELSSSCKKSVSNSPKYLNGLIDGHGVLAGYISKTVDFTEATLAGDAATADQARKEADRLRAKSNKLVTQTSTLKKKLDRLYTACLT